MIYVILILSLLILVLYILSKSYDKEYISSLNPKEHTLKLFYPLIGFLWFSLLKKEKKVQNGKNLCNSSMNDGNEVALIYQKGSLMVLVFLLLLFIVIINEVQGSSSYMIDGNKVERPESGEGAKIYELTYQVGGGKDKLELLVQEKRVKKEDRKRLFQTVEAGLKKLILNENSEYTEITTDLYFPTQYQKTEVWVTYQSDQPQYLHKDGTIERDRISLEGVEVTLSITLTYFEDTYQFIQPLIIFPPMKKEVSQKDSLKMQIEKEEKLKRGEDTFYLPKEWEGTQVWWEQEKDKSSFYLLFIGCVIVIGIPFLIDQREREREQLRKEQLLLDYPEIMMKYTLLLSAGMTTYGAWDRIVKDYSKWKDRGSIDSGKRRVKPRKQSNLEKYAYEEMLITKNEIDLGVSEGVAYERFGRRCKLLSYLRFSSILVQNLKKGSKGMIPMLEAESVQALLERKEQAKRMGEKASTKLLMPMMGMLCIVIAILMIPALMSMGV